MRLPENQPCIRSEKMNPEERLDALAEVLAEGILHLAENDELLARTAAEPPPEKRDDFEEGAPGAGDSLRKTA